MLYETPTDEQLTTTGEVNKIDEAGELPKVIIRAPTADEEFERVWWTLGRAEHYRETKAAVVLPDNEKIKALAVGPADQKSIAKENARQIFAEEVFDPTFYEAGLKALEETKTIIEQALPKLVELNKLWGFRIPEEYTIMLTAFGTGGSDNPETGEILIRTTASGKFARRNPAHVPLHEVLHMGMDDLITEKYDLTFEEHERLVDKSFVVLFEDVLPDYAMQNFEDTRIDKYVNQDTINDLPAAIAKYVAENH